MSVIGALLPRARDAGTSPQWITSPAGTVDLGVSGHGGRPTSVTTALAIIGFISRRLSTLPRVIHRVGDRTMTPVEMPDHQWLTGRPNRDQHAAPFWQQLFAHLEGWGECFAWRRTVGVGGRCVGLEVIHPSRVEVEPSGSVRRYRVDRSARTHGADRVVHVIAQSWDGIRGVPPVRAGTVAHETAAMQERLQRTMLRRGARPSGVVTTPAEVDDEALAEFYALWDEQHGGVDRAGGVVLLQGDAKFAPVSIPPSEMQLLQARQFSREEVLSLYAPGLPHHLLGWRSNTSNFGTGVEMQGIHLVQHVFGPRLALMSDVMSEACLPAGFRLGFDTSLWLEGDSKAQAEVWRKMRDGGVVSRDEWRHAVRLPPLGTEDDVLTPRNMVRRDAATGRMLDSDDDDSG